MRQILAVILCAVLCATAVPAQGQTSSTAAGKPDATGASALARTAESVYDQMVEAWHKADSIYYESDYQMTGAGSTAVCKYKLWLKKPNYARLEAYQANKLKGVLVGDGKNFCIYWPGDPPKGYAFEDQGPESGGAAAGAMAYATHAAPAGRHSIASDVEFFGIGLELVSEPSMFSGAADPMQKYIESGRLEGVETVAGEQCDVLHLRLVQGKGDVTLWLSQRDYLPRKEKESLNVDGRMTVTENWSGFSLNGAIPDDKFAWTAQKDWRKIRKATIADGLLKPGTAAPEFALTGLDGKKISLSDFKGKVVWLHVWSAG